MQEIIYRALERDPANRYASAREFANDLSNPDAVVASERAELRDWKERRSSRPRTILTYAMIAMIPLVILLLVLFFARRN